jgi:hypothetical protein
MRVSLFFHFEDLIPVMSSTAKRAFIDLSDDGSMGYLFSHDPESLQALSYTVYEVLMLTHANAGEGAFNVWSRTLNQRCVKIFNDPLRMLKLHDWATTNKVYNTKTLETQLCTLLQFFQNHHYEHVYILTSKCTKTAMGMCIQNAIKSFI